MAPAALTQRCLPSGAHDGSPGSPPPPCRRRRIPCRRHESCRCAIRPATSREHDGRSVRRPAGRGDGVDARNGARITVVRSSQVQRPALERESEHSAGRAGLVEVPVPDPHPVSTIKHTVTVGQWFMKPPPLDTTALLVTERASRVIDRQSSSAGLRLRRARHPAGRRHRADPAPQSGLSRAQCRRSQPGLKTCCRPRSEVRRSKPDGSNRWHRRL